MKLSIGMIVKNEEKNLRQCLNGIKQILNNVDSELIIADTGSTDKTVEIAREYTDNVFHFEWCNDFSAARNSTLKKAKGEWFMFIDGDEIIKDASELINFFNSGEYKRYNSATYIQRNYYDYSNLNYGDFIPIRMIKKTYDTKFENIIHEYLSPVIGKIKNLGTVAHHYGYVNTDMMLITKKAKRNIELLKKSLEKEPHNARYYMQISESCQIIKKFDDAIMYAVKGLDIFKNNNFAKENDINIMYSIYILIASLHYLKKDFEKSIEYAKEYLNCKKTSLASDMDIYAIMFFDCYKLDDKENCINAFMNFDKTYSLYKKGQLNTPDLLYRTLSYSNTSDYLDIAELAFSIYVKRDELKIAETLLNRFDIKSFVAKDDGFTVFLSALLDFADKTKKYNYITKYINELSNANSIKLQTLINGNYEKYSNIIKYLSESNINDKQYKNMLKVYCTLNNGDDILPSLNTLLDDFEYTDAYGNIFILLIKENISIERIAHITCIHNIISYIEKYLISDSDFVHNIFDYIENTDEVSDITAISFAVSLFEVMLRHSKKFEDDIVKKILHDYVEFTNMYISIVYNPELINDTNISALPQNIQFVYYIGKAIEYSENNQFVDSIKAYRKANKVYGGISDVINLMVREIQTKVELKENSSKEFEDISYKVKAMLMNFINAGKANEAQQILVKYKQINPNDKDIANFEKRLDLLKKSQ